MPESLTSKDTDQILDETTLQTELAALVTAQQLPQKIAAKISEKIQTNHLRLTRGQLYRLVDRIQAVLKGIKPTTEPLTTTNSKDTSPHTTDDMKRLYDDVADLKERLQAIEAASPEGLSTVTGRLYKNPPRHTAEDTFHPLQAIPNDPENIVIVMKWLTYMVERISKHSLPDVLGYYVDIGWISDDVRLDLLDYSKGIVETTRPDTPKTPTTLPTKDHLQSLLFIQKLKGIHLDDRFLLKIDREMERMAKSLDEYPYAPKP
jgi:flagellar protein FlaD